MSDVSRGTTPPPAPDSARGVFASRLALAEQYAALLADEATVRGLIGPREVPRLWERHLLNCAVVTDRVPEGAHVVDVGTGAGLPGLVMAVRRPDLRVTLLEPLLRRTTFLELAVEQLGLSEQVEVRRGRAEEVRDASYDVVTSRAVAPLDRLAGWCLPLVAGGGSMLAMKGSSAVEEIAAATTRWGRKGFAEPAVHELGVDFLDPPVTVVEVRRTR
ncbi:16S rRNA (guanine(527)-N(7))-methyltransferase RsmG [Nocardioides marmoraquaticus]